MKNLEFTTFLNTLANAIADTFNEDEISLLAAALTQLGDTLATIIIFKETR